MSPFVWMFLSSHEPLRSHLLTRKTLSSLIQLEYSGFDGATVPICTFTLNNSYLSNYKGNYIRLSDFPGSKNQSPRTLEAINNRNCGWFFESDQKSFLNIPNRPIAYWLKDELLDSFSGPKVKDFGRAMTGLQTGNTEMFLRLWHEVDQSNVGYGCSNRVEAEKSGRKWFPCNKGGEFKKWYGNLEYVVNWKSDGRDIKKYKEDGLAAGKITRNNSKCWNQDRYFHEGIGWSRVTSGELSLRLFEPGVLFEISGPTLFLNNRKNVEFFLGLLNSVVGREIGKLLAPTLSFTPNLIENFPVGTENINYIPEVQDSIKIAKQDWDLYETSWNFTKSPLLLFGNKESSTLESNFSLLRTYLRSKTVELKKLEESNNAYFIELFGLSDDFENEVKIQYVSLKSNPAYRYGKSDSTDDLERKFVSDTIAEFISYFIGNMMGRFSLDRDGLVYAQSSNEGFKEINANGAYQSFPADEDGIISLASEEWLFDDDATTRFKEFVKTVWGDEHLSENMDFVAESLCLHALKPKKGESAMDTIRRYFSTQFFKEHCKTYKKRPIYWLFSSGKEKAFECLVYLHRYNEGTLSRMRTEYVTPLMGKYDAQHTLLSEQQIQATGTEARLIEKELRSLEKKQAELRNFDEQLKHYAEMRISLDLDEGVKANYGKFGNLLADVKTIHGKAVK
jgi:type II restriction/modification system DNA methylase subunit YeeA